MTDQPSTPAPSGAPSPDVETVLAQGLADHVACNMVTSREGQTIWSCGVQTPKPAPESTLGFFQLHHAHVVVALAAALRGAGLPEPNGVTVTEWSVEVGWGGPAKIATFESGDDFDSWLRQQFPALAGRRRFTRQRTTYPDRVTDWQEATP